jgi:hypothetical protein
VNHCDPVGLNVVFGKEIQLISLNKFYTHQIGAETLYTMTTCSPTVFAPLIYELRERTNGDSLRPIKTAHDYSFFVFQRMAILG